MNLGPSIEMSILRARARVRFGYPWWLRPWLSRDVIAITLGRRVYVSPKVAAHGKEQIERLLHHELTHVRQVNDLGVTVFLVRYVTEFVRHYRRERDVQRAYRSISFEIEAWAAEDEAAGQAYNPAKPS